VSTTWDPSLYLDFDDHRSRPFHDLLARIGAPRTGGGAPRRVVDLGCGPGHLTGLLAARWPDAAVTALDSSAQMVAAARERGIDAQQADVVGWMPAPDTDVVVTNAVLHWVPSHPDLLPRWLHAVAPGAWFAMQVPGNFGAPSHRIARELAGSPEWSSRLGTLVLREDDAVATPHAYADLLADEGCAVDAWETTYMQRLSGERAVLEWITGTALRPIRAALDDAAWAAFREQLAPRLDAAYPPRPDGTTWFEFRRIFFVAQTPPRG
jgi:trans-aconitate 2-methyltransferase